MPRTSRRSIWLSLGSAAAELPRQRVADEERADLEREFLNTAEHVDLQRSCGRMLVQNGREFGQPLHHAAVDFHHDVTDSDAGRLRRTMRREVGNDDAGVLRQPQAFGDRRRDRLRDDADVDVVDVPVSRRL